LANTWDGEVWYVPDEVRRLASEITELAEHFPRKRLKRVLESLPWAALKVEDGVEVIERPLIHILRWLLDPVEGRWTQTGGMLSGNGANWYHQDGTAVWQTAERQLRELLDALTQARPDVSG
jgi:hypothetical protein